MARVQDGMVDDAWVEAAQASSDSLLAPTAR
jgi:hypothetical protein